jgi:hypothetical protein
MDSGSIADGLPAAHLVLLALSAAGVGEDLIARELCVPVEALATMRTVAIAKLTRLVQDTS